MAEPVRAAAERARYNGAASNGSAIRRRTGRSSQTIRPSRASRATSAGRSAPVTPPSVDDELASWVLAQATNVHRHLEALRPFRWSEVGDPATGPSRAHLAAVNSMMNSLRRPLFTATRSVRRAAGAAAVQPSPDRLEQLLYAKSRAHRWVRKTERV